MMEEYTASEEEVHLEPQTETTLVAEPEVQREAQNPAHKEKKHKKAEKSIATKEAKDNEAFISDEAYFFWKKNLSDKGFIEERGFGTFISQFVEIIEKRGWSLFCKNKPPRFAVVVKEFYSNMIDMREDSVYVRGEGSPWVMKGSMRFYKSKIPRTELSSKDCLENPIMTRLSTS